MSLEVLLIQEDATYNGSIIKPVLEKILDVCGRPNAKIKDLYGPVPKGYDNIKRVLSQRLSIHGVMADLWIFICDSDLKDRSDEFTSLMKQAERHGKTLICCAAEPEVEAWLVAGNLDKLTTSIPWSQLRSNSKFKEEVFRPLLQQHGEAHLKDGGRKTLMKNALRNYTGLCQKCPEIKELEQQVRSFLERTAK